MKSKTQSVMVTKLRQLLHYYQEGYSLRRISDLVSLSRTSIRNYLDRQEESGKTISELLKEEDATLLRIMTRAPYKPEADPRLEALTPLLPYYASELKKRYVTMQLLWEEYTKRFPGQSYCYSTYKSYLQDYVKSHSYSYHNTYSPGEVLQVDYAGDALYLTDLKDGSKHAVSVLCCVLPCSSLEWLYAMEDKTVGNLLDGISRCLEYIGGVPRRILSDNMKQWVKKREKDGPVFTDAAMEFGLHYGVLLDATAVRKPRHKSSVEGGVHRAYTRIYARMRDEVFYTIDAINERLNELTKDFNNRKMKEHNYSRREYFESNEKGCLNPLPETRFSLRYTRTCKVGSNYHIYISTHQYSVPYEYVNKQVTAVFDKENVEIYDADYVRIAVHKRSFKRYGYTTEPGHMPEAHLAYQLCKDQKNAAYYLQRAKHAGANTESYVNKLLENYRYIEHAYRSCEALLQLGLKYGDHVLEQACELALAAPVTNYNVVKTIIETKAYKSIQQESTSSSDINHENLRGPKEYK